MMDTAHAITMRNALFRDDAHVSERVQPARRQDGSAAADMRALLGMVGAHGTQAEPVSGSESASESDLDGDDVFEAAQCAQGQAPMEEDEELFQALTTRMQRAGYSPSEAEARELRRSLKQSLNRVTSARVFP